MNNLVSKFSMKKIYPIIEVNEDKIDNNLVTKYKNDSKRATSCRINNINNLNQSMNNNQESTWGHLHRASSKFVPNFKNNLNEVSNNKTKDSAN